MQARLDVGASGVGGERFDHTFIDVRVFNPFAASNRSTFLYLFMDTPKANKSLTRGVLRLMSENINMNENRNRQEDSLHGPLSNSVFIQDH